MWKRVLRGSCRLACFCTACPASARRPADAATEENRGTPRTNLPRMVHSAAASTTCQAACCHATAQPRVVITVPTHLAHWAVGLLEVGLEEGVKQVAGDALDGVLGEVQGSRGRSGAWAKPACRRTGNAAPTLPCTARPAPPHGPRPARSKTCHAARHPPSAAQRTHLKGQHVDALAILDVGALVHRHNVAQAHAQVLAHHLQRHSRKRGSLQGI